MELDHNYQAVLEIIAQHPESGIGWYGLERIFAILNHSISKDGLLMPILKELVEHKLITSTPENTSQHSHYVLTAKGEDWLKNLSATEILHEDEMP
jgi:DNA-binding PadR family transcriptional regulator